MKHNNDPVIKDLVLVGGGHSHVTVLKNFAMHPVPGVRLTLVSRDLQAPYSGMLPGYIAGHYSYDEAHIELRPLCGFAGARFYHDEVTGLDSANKKLACRNRPDIPYDVLSINIGSAPNTLIVPGAKEYTTPVKPIDRFVSKWKRLSERVLQQRDLVRIGIVGAGAAGVELCLAVQNRLQQLLTEKGQNNSRLEFHLFTDGEDILVTHNRSVRARFRRVLNQRGINIHAGHRVNEVNEKTLQCANGESFELDEILWVTMAGAQSWLGEAGLDVDEQGFATVKDTLESTSHPGIFLAGDIAHVLNHPRPKSGVFAVRQGPPLADNLRRFLSGQTPRAFKPQKHFLSIISTGEKYAIASRSWWALEGRWVWRWKDWIDRRFMDKFNQLPALDDAIQADNADVVETLSASEMRCGGCGAKVGAPVLEKVLTKLQPVERDDVLIGLHEPDDGAVVHVPDGKLMVHTVDSFRTFIDDPYVFGQIAANHALSDIYAMGAEPQTALSIVTIPYGIESKTEETLTQMMQGALEVFRLANTSLVGGHTSEGQELSLGFAVNGLVDQDHILRKGGMRAGDYILLTQAIGTGTLFAADMRHKAKGRWIAEALEKMKQSNREAALCFFEHAATACTDVTGFGLLGHLLEMLKTATVNVEIDLDALPCLEGAEAMIGSGIFSSLQEQNLHLQEAIEDLPGASSHPRFPLLFDPQTSGGLLASVPGAQASACVEKLHKLGYYDTMIIGRVSAGAGGSSRIKLSPL